MSASLCRTGKQALAISTVILAFAERVSGDMPVRGPVRPDIDMLCGILDRLEALTTEAEAR